jgi:hypothetical protein
MAKHNKRIEKTVIFNRRILILIAIFILPLCFFRSVDKEFAFVLFLLSFFALICIFFTPLYFVFTKKEITVIWIFQYKRTIPWASIKSIIELKWGEVHRDLPKYEIIYHLNYKGYIVPKEFDIPKNKRTKKMMEKYAKYKIV